MTAAVDQRHLLIGTDSISVKCECGSWIDEPVHVIGLKFYHPNCCPCQAAPAERSGAVEGMVGEQSGLFGA